MGEQNSTVYKQDIFNPCVERQPNHFYKFAIVSNAAINLDKYYLYEMCIWSLCLNTSCIAGSCDVIVPYFTFVRNLHIDFSSGETSSLPTSSE